MKMVNIKTATDAQMEQILQEAIQAGRKAAKDAQVVPMIVGEAIGLSNQIDPSKPVEYVADGVCGFAWVTVKPANSRFAKFLVSKGLARKSFSEPGVYMWISDYNQSMQRKEAYAHAFAGVLVDYDINAYSQSRMD